jgi:Tfp pilus assembly protein PilO
VTLTDRDRKILLGAIPILLLVGFWFLVLSPKRAEVAQATEELTQQQQRRDTAQAAVSQASSAKSDFESDYTEMVRLGKAIPSAVDMPGLLVQLDKAANGTDIKFTKIATGEREAPGENPQAAPPADGGGGGSAPPAAAGGEQAQSAPGGAAEAANNASATSDQRNSAAQQSGVQPGDTQTSTPAGADAAPAAAGASPAGLETVPLELEFRGNFFNLANFFHRVKRLVEVSNENLVVSGRLVTIEGVSYSSDPEVFPTLTAEIQATVYLVPKAQGTTAGATPQGPAPATPADSGSGGSPTPPAAAATN